MVPNVNSQRGAALLTSLIILVLVLLVAIVSVRFSNLELRLAVNEEIRADAFQVTQSAVDGTFYDAANTPVIGTGNDTSCTTNFEAVCANHSNCVVGADPCNLNTTGVTDRITFIEDILSNNVASSDLGVRITRRQIGGSDFGTPPRGLDSSIRAFQTAEFSVEAYFDKTDESLGKGELHEGLTLIIPKL